MNGPGVTYRLPHMDPRSRKKPPALSDPFRWVTSAHKRLIHFRTRPVDRGHIMYEAEKKVKDLIAQIRNEDVDPVDPTHGGKIVQFLAYTQALVLEYSCKQIADDTIEKYGTRYEPRVPARHFVSGGTSVPILSAHYPTPWTARNQAQNRRAPHVSLTLTPRAAAEYAERGWITSPRLSSQAHIAFEVHGHWLSSSADKKVAHGWVPEVWGMGHRGPMTPTKLSALSDAWDKNKRIIKRFRAGSNKDVVFGNTRDEHWLNNRAAGLEQQLRLLTVILTVRWAKALLGTEWRAAIREPAAYETVKINDAVNMHYGRTFETALPADSVDWDNPEICAELGAFATLPSLTFRVTRRSTRQEKRA